jgi:hypothetical protein
MTELWIRCSKCGKILKIDKVTLEEQIPAIQVFVSHQCIDEKTNSQKKPRKKRSKPKPKSLTQRIIKKLNEPIF